MNSKTFSRFMRFLGGRDIIFTLIVLILLGIAIYIYDKVSFIFHPLIVISTTVIPPIILAFIAYYLINPIVNLLEKIHIKRVWGIIIIPLVIGGALTGVIILSAPAIEAQVTDLVNQLPKYITKMSANFDDWISHSFLGPYYEQGHQWVSGFLSDLPEKITSYLGGAMEGLRNVATTVTHVVVSIVTFPFVLFFLLKDGHRFKGYCLKLVPPKYRNDLNQILHNMDVQVGSYIQGQIIVATCIGVLLFIGYLIIGLEYALILAIIAAITSVVPYLGPAIAISPAIIIAIVNSPFMLLKLAIVWASVQFLEGHFISPNIMGRTMKIHPLTIIIVLLVAGNLFGVVGVILGIPGYAIIKVIAQYIFKNFKRRYNRFYGDDYGEYELQSTTNT